MVKTTKLGGTASHIVVGKVAHGLMTMTLNGNVPDEQAFESIKSGVDALPSGAKMILNSADFYGQGRTTGNLELLARFYDKYPEYVDKTFLSVKGLPVSQGPDEPIGATFKASVERSIAALRGTKKIDLFQPARIHRSVPADEAVRFVAAMVKERKFDHVGLSECSEASLRLGNSAYPISLVEIEVSPMSYEEETKKVIAATAELDIAIAAYSPLGRGLTTGTIKSLSDVPENSGFRRLDRFTEENMTHNQPLIDALVTIAAKKGCTPAQLSIAWVGALRDKVIPLPGSSRKERTLENQSGGDVELSAKELAEIATVMEKNPVRGHRYYGEQVDAMLWG